MYLMGKVVLNSGIFKTVGILMLLNLFENGLSFLNFVYASFLNFASLTAAF